MKHRVVMLMVLFGLCVGHSQAQNSPAVPAESGSGFDARLSGYAYPFPTATFALSSQQQSLEMSYMWLPGDAGKPVVVLLHGKNFNGAYWQQTASMLAAQGYGVLMPDQIGFGKSSKPTAYQYSFAALAHHTRQLMAALQIERAVMVGHSMGGMLATRFALSYPEATERLVLVNPIGLENYLHYVAYQDVAFFNKMELQNSPAGIVAYQRKNYYDGNWSERYAALTEPLMGWVQGPDWPQLAKVSALTYDMIFTQPVVEEFARLQVPTALILGTRDRTGPGRQWQKPGVAYELGRYDQLGDKVRQRNPAIQLYELDGLGHLPHIEDFERFQAALAQALSTP
ncbi:alpha/beta hydrolase [Aestuariicella hydrocarbonica]|uniref:Alpha/beta hydrolase n=1 Tax=Pseudomaricurvus hydrocarbonicus TaxID=1470433 RepID=A0A9E5MNY1_9GAMM|nr:alpha/beta hydrolase [Aestuariicella hydrocarbonica]NHO67664.1 alpha/beta hydrolase [Aestuariicella hydrocarbonica]